MEKDFLIPQKEMEKIVKLTDDASSISIVVCTICYIYPYVSLLTL